MIAKPIPFAGRPVRYSMAAIAFISIAAQSAPVRYDVNLAFNGATAVGYLNTDGHLGALAVSNILDWEFSLTYGSVSRTINSQGQANAPVVSLNPQFGPALYASATELLIGNGLTSGAYTFENRSSDYSTSYRLVVNPVVNSQMNGVALDILIDEGGSSLVRQLSFDRQAGAVFGTHQTATELPEPSTLWLLGGAVFAAISGMRRKNQLVQRVPSAG